jgi:hypothetical protein
MVQGLASNQGVSLMVAEVFGLLLAIILLIVLAPKAKKVVRKK